jgi:hypothetical protein
MAIINVKRRDAFIKPMDLPEEVKDMKEKRME